MDELIKKISKNSLMNFDEYKYIANIVANKKLLVFGCGNDSELWRTICKKVHFLEHNDKWIDKKLNDISKISYTIMMKDSVEILNNLENMHVNLTIKNISHLFNEDWDIVLVDSPEGYNMNAHHGRIQSIYTANLLVKNNGSIIVHDIDRKIEDMCVNKMLGSVLYKDKKLGHYMKKLGSAPNSYLTSSKQFPFVI